MVVTVIAVMVAVAMIGISIIANARFRHDARLPMQWSLSGEVNWSAPRLVALAFIPSVSIGVLTVFVIIAATMRPRPGQEGMLVPTLIVMGLTFIAAQLLHLWLADKTLHREGN